MKGKGGETALLKAMINDHHDCVDPLIQAGADVNLPSDDDRTPLTSAAYSGPIKSLQKLMSAGADVKASTS